MDPVDEKNLSHSHIYTTEEKSTTYISDLIHRLRKRADIRLQATSRRSVQENLPDRLAELLYEAANALEKQL